MAVIKSNRRGIFKFYGALIANHVIIHVRANKETIVSVLELAPTRSLRNAED